MEFSEQVLYTLPLYLGPLFIMATIDHFRGSGGYRINDTLTNATLALGNLGFSFVFLAGVVLMYNYIYTNYALFTLDQSSPLTYVIAFILYDFFYYWNHRFHHMIGIFWADHLVHHSAENMNFGVSIRLSYFVELTMWMTFIIMALSGISLEVFLVVSYIEVSWAFLIHTKWLKETPFLDKIINTPSLHRAHHARDRIYIDKNFGGILVIWDKIFGTYQRELKEVPPTFGISESFESYSPLMLNIQFLKVIREKIRYSQSALDMIKSVFFSPSWIPQGADPDKIFSEKSKIEAKDFTPNNPIISQYAKLSCVGRFIQILIVFIVLMTHFSTLPIEQNISLSVLFLWLCHYNGITFDGRKLGVVFELITQLIIISYAVTCVYNPESMPFMMSGLLSALVLSLTSFSLFLLTNKKNQAVKPMNPYNVST